MRRGMRPKWLTEGDVLFGIDLSADYVAEHEFGINDLKLKLGIDGARAAYSDKPATFTKAPGLPRRMVTKNQSVRLYESKDAAALICKEDFWQSDFEDYAQKNGVAKALKDRLPGNLRYGNSLSTAWSGSDFGIHAVGEDAEKIRDLAKAFVELKVAVWTGGGGVFENAGLVIAWSDRIPQHGIDMLREADEEHAKLMGASDKTGILKRLKDAGRGYYACSPSWNKRKGRKTAHPVIYFLNPTEQDQNNFGWFTVEELDQWIGGKGPIPKLVVQKKT